MKKLLIVLLLLPVFGFSQQETESIKLTQEEKEKYATAKVDIYRGLFLFINSKPTEEYEVIGEVVMNFVDNRKYKDQLYVLTEKAHDRYPTAWGLIVDTSKGRFRADVIIFKREAKNTEKK